MSDRLRSLPSVDRVLDHPELEHARSVWTRRVLLAVVRGELGHARARVQGGEDAPSEQDVAARCAERLVRLDAPRPRRVVNATGVVVHTNLGRAPLGSRALAELVDAAGGYCDLEYDVEQGARGDRHAHVAGLFDLMFPGHGSLVVNNNAAALLLALNTLARGKEVVISRGELVEIGGSFRVPDILERSGAKLVEVGTTNRTHPRDYERALGPDTGLILQVWPSNFRVVGFTRSVPLPELVRIGGARGLPVVVDQGCGRLFRDTPGPESEIPVEELLAGSASLVCFSGDKLFGGPQAGVLVGRPELVRECASNPLARALRPGKLTLAALAASCRDWLQLAPQHGAVPVARMLSRPRPELRAAAERLADLVRQAAPRATVEVEPGISRVGGGAAPEEDLPTTIVRAAVPGVSEARVLEALRASDPPVVARANEGAVVFDPRTLDSSELLLVARAFGAAVARRTD